MLKPYYDWNKNGPVLVVYTSNLSISRPPEEIEMIAKHTTTLCNSEILADLDGKLAHASPEGRESLTTLIEDFQNLFPDNPRQTNLISHDVEVGNICTSVLSKP